MKRHKAFKFRLYPTAAQATLINRTIGCSRFVFNHFLAKWNDTYKETGKCHRRCIMVGVPVNGGGQEKGFVTLRREV
jgi:transposase